MSPRKALFGGNGKTQGDSSMDPMGTVRRSPSCCFLAVMWPSPPHPRTWHVIDHHGSVGYEEAARIAHWPVIGATPGSPAAGMELARSDGRVPIEDRELLPDTATVGEGMACLLPEPDIQARSGNAAAGDQAGAKS